MNGSRWRSAARKTCGPSAEELAGELGADQPRQEIVDDDPLVVPGRRPPRLVEETVVGHAVLAEPVDEEVVEPHHRHVELGNEQMDEIGRASCRERV